MQRTCVSILAIEKFKIIKVDIKNIAMERKVFKKKSVNSIG